MLFCGLIVGMLLFLSASVVSVWMAVSGYKKVKESEREGVRKGFAVASPFLILVFMGLAYWVARPRPDLGPQTK
jgi:heme O synthase-like polyprenyltransferase